MKKLISVCSHNPANLQEMSMFLNYYLPTAEKFAREYEQLLGYENFGENMESLKQDIPQGVRELAEAFPDRTLYRGVYKRHGHRKIKVGP